MSKIIWFVLALTWSLAVAAKGGESFGGGNIIEDELAKRDEIRTAIENSKSSVVAAFNLLSYGQWQVAASSNPDEVVTYHRPAYYVGALKIRHLAEQLYNSEKNIFTVLRQYEPYFPAQGPCWNEAHEDVDASIVNTPKGTICYSLDRLSQRITERGRFISLTALVAHEHSHLVGINEEDARVIQKVFEKMIQPNVESMLARWKAESISNLKILLQTTELAKLGIGQSDHQEFLCGEIQRIQSFIYSSSSLGPFYNLENTLQANGVRLYSRKDSDLPFLILMRITNLSHACDKYPQQSYIKAFEKTHNLSPIEFARSQGLIGSNLPGVIHFVQPGLSEPISLELDDLATNIRQQIEFEKKHSF